MESILTYIIKVTGLLAIVWLFYFLALRRHTFYTANRWYLLLGTASAFVLPLISFPSAAAQNELIRETVRQFNEINIGILFAPLPQKQITTLVSGADIIVWPINLGIVLFFGRLCLQLRSFFRQKRTAEKCVIFNTKVFILKDDMPPFSFFGQIFINPAKHTEAEIAEIIVHEKTHIKQGHLFDLLFMEIVTVLCWFNPFAWLLRAAMRQNLEYLADRQVLNVGFDKTHYQYNLVRTSVAGVPSLPVANNFIFSNLKKRIMMMNKKQSPHVAALRYFLLVPLFAFVWMVVHAGELSAKLKEVSIITKEVNIQNEKPDESKMIIKAPEGEKGVVAYFDFKERDKTIEIQGMRDNALYILDSKAINAEDVQFLNINDIKTIFIAKDAQESMIEKYGEKAKNGVVYISSKETEEKNWNESNTKKILQATEGDDGSVAFIFGEKDRNPNEKKEIEIRGVGRNARYILDEKEISAEEVKSLDANTIEVVIVRKGASATHEYGEWGKNGVVDIITTEFAREKKSRGESGRLPVRDTLDQKQKTIKDEDEKLKDALAKIAQAQEEIKQARQLSQEQLQRVSQIPQEEIRQLLEKYRLDADSTQLTMLKLTEKNRTDSNFVRIFRQISDRQLTEKDKLLQEELRILIAPNSSQEEIRILIEKNKALQDEMMEKYKPLQEKLMLSQKELTERYGLLQKEMMEKYKTLQEEMMKELRLLQEEMIKELRPLQEKIQKEKEE